MRNIVVIGSANTDMVIKTHRFPQPGETVLGGQFFMFQGGKGANQAVAAARLQGQVTFIAKTGNDIFGKQALAQYEKEGIDTRYIGLDAEKASGVALITVDGNGENSIVVAPGANEALSASDIDRASEVILKSELLLLQLEIPLPTVRHALSLGLQYNKKVILNPAPAQPLSAEVLQGLYLITPNESEAEILTGLKVTDAHTAEKAAQVLLEKGVRQVVITLGAKGAFLKSQDMARLIPAPRVEALDTTAAGDVFNGALAVGIAEGMALEEAIAFANRAAALSVTRMGAQASAPYRQELMP